MPFFFKCSIDLKKNVLVIGTTGSQTTFLPEGELPECARLAYGAGREDMRPEEIADQELAEALQKSVEDAGIWNVQVCCREGTFPTYTPSPSLLQMYPCALSAFPSSHTVQEIFSF